MKVLCLFQKFDFDSSTIYLDLVQALNNAGHKVFILAGTSKEIDEDIIYDEGGIKTAYVLLPNQFGVGKIKKGMVQLMIEPRMIRACRKHFYNEKIDLIIYPTPPITLSNVVNKLKKHYGAKTYLMLKDIFPQNAADLRMMSNTGLVFKFFKHIEKKLYSVSDIIGCMSDANIAYMKTHCDKQIAQKLELFPNSVRIKEIEEYDRGNDEIVKFVFGGNLGKPQAVDFLLDGIAALSDYDKAHFLIIGDGSESARVSTFISKLGLKNVNYHKSIPRDEYENILKRQDVGIISLHPDFTIPNFPSRLLSYMQMSMPVLAVTDSVTDIGSVITDKAKCGFFTNSDDLDAFVDTIKHICDNRDKLSKLGKNGRDYLIRNYNVESSVKILEKAL